MVIGLTQKCGYEEAKGRSSTQRCREVRMVFQQLGARLTNISIVQGPTN
jgi:hypothetical protein